MIRFAVVACLALSATTALAGDEKERQEVEARYAAVTNVDFAELDVHAALVKPSVPLVHRVMGLKFDSLVELRADFKPEMKASVAEVR